MSYREILSPRFLRTDLASSVRTQYFTYGPCILLINSEKHRQRFEYLSLDNAYNEDNYFIQ